ncbi:MAG: DnaJ domain-containing protein [Terracidiphilus sp.]
MTTAAPDYYELLQISPRAEADTIHRVFRFLAARAHPDNSESGDAGNFQLLKTAYDVLSNPKSRADYDAKRKPVEQPPLSASIDFMDTLEGEMNRRVAVLAVLYSQRRGNPNYPEVSLAEIETRLGFPRDYLDFTLWYLSKKGYISKSDNAQYVLTVDGVDFVETQRGRQPALNKLLTSGSGATAASAQKNTDAARWPDAPEATGQRDPHSTTIAEHAGQRHAAERRVGAPDLRAIKVERRGNGGDRRVNREAPRTSK